MTINNYDALSFAQFTIAQPVSDYYIWAKEVGASGTPHLQCYICFQNKKTLTAVKKLFTTAHIEVKRGTSKRASDYCKKGDQPKLEWDELGTEGPNFGKNAAFFEYGFLPLEQQESGGRATKELWDTTKKLAEDDRLEEIDSEIFIKHYFNLKRIRSDKRNARVPKDLDWVDNSPPNDWFYGPTGVGKSFRARKENPDAYLKMNNKWWENYTGQDTVLIEELDTSSEWMGSFLKVWADRYGFRAEIKNDSIVARPQKIVVTSNYHPRDIWKDPSMHEPIMRRFNIIHIEKLELFDTTVEINSTSERFKKKLKRQQEQDLAEKITSYPKFRMGTDGQIVLNQTSTIPRPTLIDLIEQIGDTSSTQSIDVDIDVDNQNNNNSS